jgi:hypothetical protein
MRALASLLVALLAFVALIPSNATAAPASASASFDTNKGAQGSRSGGNYAWPELVVGGNALSFIAPFQIGAVGYLPKGRFTFQYDRQLSPALARHWIHVGVGLVFDRGDWKNFRADSCNTDDFTCQKGGVVGWDAYAGYTYRFFLKKRPWLVPHVKGALGFSWWALPNVGGGRDEREQDRFKSWTLNVRPGGGLRIFLLDQLGIGMDVNVPIGFLVHTEVPYAGSQRKRGGFLLGFEIMPLTLEYRF